MDAYEKICNERHRAIGEKLVDCEGRLDGHDKEIAELRTSSATNTADIKHLTKSMDGLTKAIWWLITTIAVTGIGFIIDYIVSTIK